MTNKEHEKRSVIDYFNGFYSYSYGIKSLVLPTTS